MLLLLAVLDPTLWLPVGFLQSHLTLTSGMNNATYRSPCDNRADFMFASIVWLPDDCASAGHKDAYMPAAEPGGTCAGTMKTFAAAILLLGVAVSPAAACGWENERCCSTKKGNDACKVDGLVCISGRCKPEPEPECGGNGEVCCPGEECDLHSLVCLSGSCTPCGKEGEPVCNGVLPSTACFS